MNTSKMIIAGLLLTGLSLSADESFQLKKEGSEESSQAFKLNFRKKQSPFKLLKVKESRMLSSSAKDWDEAEVTGSGLFINFGIHFPSKKFLNPYEFSYPIVPQYKIGFDFELGNFFRFAKIAEGKFGIGMRVTWLSLSYTAAKIDKDIYRVVQISPLRLGPQFSMAINETMGLDVFYGIGFNFTQSFGTIDDPTNSVDVGYGRTYLGASHEVGAAFHYKVFSLGLGYRFGRLANVLNVYDGEEYDNDNVRSSVGNFRITLGFRF